LDWEQFVSEELTLEQLGWKCFEFNCGCAEIGDFAGSFDLLVAELKKVEEICKDDKWGLLQATTIASQRNAIAALRQCKFKVVKRFKNPNSGHWVTVWMKLI